MSLDIYLGIFLGEAVFLMCLIYDVMRFISISMIVFYRLIPSLTLVCHPQAKCRPS